MVDEELIKAMNKMAEVLTLVAEKVFGVVIVPPLPNIEDYTPEAVRKRQLIALKRSIKRRRRLSAEDMLEIYLLHKEEHVSFRSVAKRFNVSDWTIRKTFQKIEKVLAKG